MIFSGRGRCDGAASFGRAREMELSAALLLRPARSIDAVCGENSRRLFSLWRVAEAGCCSDDGVYFFNLEFDASLVRLIPVSDARCARFSPRWRRCFPRPPGNTRAGGYVAPDSGGCPMFRAGANSRSQSEHRCASQVRRSHR